MMNTLPLNKAHLNGSSIDITSTRYNWDVDLYQDIQWVSPNVSDLTKSECVAILSYRDEGLKTDNINVLRYDVARSDEQHWDEFYPCGDSYHCDIPDTRLRQTPEVMQGILRHSPIIVLKLDGKLVLAASQEYPNMELEFCRAYMKLGFLPPLSMINFSLPHGDVEPDLISACMRTVEVYEGLCKNTRTTLNSIKERRLAAQS